MKKLPKDSPKVEYRPGKLAHHCGPILQDDVNYCKFFDQWGKNPGNYGFCSKVEGVIRPYYGCKLFEKHQT